MPDTSKRRRRRKGKKRGQRAKPYQRTVPNAKLHYDSAALVSIPESTRITGLGASLTRRLVLDGTLPSVQLGSRLWIVKSKLFEWLEQLSRERRVA